MGIIDVSQGPQARVSMIGHLFGEIGYSVVKETLRWAAVAMLAALMSVLFAAPANAAANPFTPASACANDFGGKWAHTTDGHRSIYNHAGTQKWGDVYLMYNSGSGKNCVALIKRSFVGSTSEQLNARLDVKGKGSYTDNGYYKYYAAVQAGARDTCVKYWGYIATKNTPDQEIGGNGRSHWGNCG